MGGSLLDWPGLAVAIDRFLATRRGTRLVVLVGGGAIVEAIRDLDRIHGLGDDLTHQLAIRAMGISADAAAAILPRSEVVPDLDSLDRAWARGLSPILRPDAFLDDDARRPDPLAHDWSVTSDSIAARLAVRLGDAPLILLKSRAPSPGLDRAKASATGLVDSAFPAASATLSSVAIVNLRDPAATLHPLAPSSRESISIPPRLPGPINPPPKSPSVD